MTLHTQQSKNPIATKASKRFTFIIPFFVYFLISSLLNKRSYADRPRKVADSLLFQLFLIASFSMLSLALNKGSFLSPSQEEPHCPLLLVSCGGSRWVLDVSFSRCGFASLCDTYLFLSGYLKKTKKDELVLEK